MTLEIERERISRVYLKNQSAHVDMVKYDIVLVHISANPISNLENEDDLTGAMVELGIYF